MAVRVARDERQEIVQRHGEITPGAALCIAVECAAVIFEPGRPLTQKDQLLSHETLDLDHQPQDQLRDIV